MNYSKNLLNWVEIPVGDMTRAKAFYEAVLQKELQLLNFGEGFSMAMIPSEERALGGALVEHKDFYTTGSQGPLIYLNGGEDLQPMLDRAEKAGAKVIIAKRQISPEYGYMAVIEDSEGNRIGMHSMN